MIHKTSRVATLMIVALALVLTACASDSESTSTAMNDHADEHDAEFRFGEPGHADDADRVIEITADEDLTFSPDSFTVSAGETITFRIVNQGNLPHDFTLGDQETQDAHEAEMAEMMESGETMMHDDANAISLPPGETKELTWHFTEAGTVLIGCHQAGHYAAGMTGTITIES